MQALEIKAVPVCASITLRDVELSPLAVAPDSPPSSSRSVVRLHCTVVDDPAMSGTITFRLGTELRDSAGNHLAEDYVLLLDNN
jgi:hypothetical protein